MIVELKTKIRRLFFSEQFILAVLLVNAVVIYLQLDGFSWHWLEVVDYACTLLFVTEMIFKLLYFGWRTYWSDGWNRLDGTVVILSLPTLVLPFIDVSLSAFNALIVLRLVRVVKFFRVMRFFPNFSKLVEGFSRAMRQTWAVLLSFALFIAIFALINCALFKDLSSTYFGTPLDAMYSVFRMFTVEGWYEIPDALAGDSPAFTHLIRLFFCAQVLSGGIIGMSFINSVFVDAMAEDNNDDVKEQLRQMEKKIDELTEIIKSSNPE